MLKKLFYVLAWISLMAGPAYSGTLSAACAANFTGAMKELAALYQSRTGTTVQCAFGSTGMLYGQIRNGAPYDLFFAADEERPALLFKEGLALKPSTYATGRVVLWTADMNLAGFGDWKEVLASPGVTRVGIATPETAPYGHRASEAMAAAKLFTRTEPKLVYGKSVGVAFQYAYSGSADVSFVALSQALSDKGRSGSYWPVEEAHPVSQAACILKDGSVEDAQKFLEWLHAPEALAVISRYGYE